MDKGLVSREATVLPPGGGLSHMKGAGMLVGSFELNP